MTTITATRASRSFSAVLDAVEKRESFTITRDGRPVAELRPVTEYPLDALLDALAALPKDPTFADDMEEIHRAANQPWVDPWLT